MATSSTSNAKVVCTSAIYTSPDAQQTTLSSDLLPTLGNQPSTKDKTTYISQLRKTTTQLQHDVNALLTSKMEEDKAAEAGSSDKRTKTKEEKEEEMYGEEDVEEE